jgi:hypothetical protein
MRRGMDVWERIRYARNRAFEAEEVELQRRAEATTVELQQAESVRVVIRPPCPTPITLLPTMLSGPMPELGRQAMTSRNSPERRSQLGA